MPFAQRRDRRVHHLPDVAIARSSAGAVPAYPGSDLLALGVIAVAAGVGASALLARTISAPVARLVQGTREVAAGNFDYAVDVHTEDELGALAESFNSMTRGLRERADMQKFVSHSTMEMIQSRRRPPPPNGSG